MSDARRKMMKEVLRMKGEGAAAAAAAAGAGAVEGEGAQENAANAAAFSDGQVLSRTIPGPVLAQYTERIRALEPELREYFRQEKERASLDKLQMEAERAENLLLHEQEINSRPARTWYQTEKQKDALRESSRDQVRHEQAAAQLGKAEAQAKLSAAERARAMALKDDYPLDAKDRDKSHKLSRKKRRRLEALEASREAGEDEEGEAAARRAAAALEAAPKRAKVSLREKEGAKRDKILSEIGMKKVAVSRDQPAAAEGEGNEEGAVQTKKGKGQVQMKVVRQSFAVGGLDQDYVDWGMGSADAQGGSKGGMTKSQIRQAARERPFTDFDPTKKLRKGGKLGKKAFKSKAKFKRR